VITITSPLYDIYLPLVIKSIEALLAPANIMQKFYPQPETEAEGCL
jgi:hypothetical protein